MRRNRTIRARCPEWMRAPPAAACGFPLSLHCLRWRTGCRNCLMAWSGAARRASSFLVHRCGLLHILLPGILVRGIIVITHSALVGNFPIAPAGVDKKREDRS